MNAITNSERLKKVMRIALVGVRPADQVMLKGYLRILLRLEADLEWVSANHTAVDLFMINSEFSQSESVQRLLTTKPQAAVIYIARNDTGDGHLVGNVLTLPLKELEELNQWLIGNVININTSQKTKASVATSQSADTVTSPATANEQNRPVTRQSLDDIIASRNTSLNNSPVATTPQAAPQSNAQLSTAKPANPVLNLLKIIEQLQSREDTVLSLVDNKDEVLAYIQPKQQRVWVESQTLNFSQPMRLKLEAFSVNTEPKDSLDLVQWLWQQATNQAPQLTALLRPQINYHITSWVKPSEGEARHDQLKIQNVLESREATLSQLAQISQCDHNHIKRTVIGLVVAGVMSRSVYETLQHQLSATLATQAAAEETATPQSLQQPIATPADSANAAQISTPHASDASVAQEVSESAGNDGMKGFLSRLRRKLGI